MLMIAVFSVASQPGGVGSSVVSPFHPLNFGSFLASGFLYFSPVRDRAEKQGYRKVDNKLGCLSCLTFLSVVNDSLLQEYFLLVVFMCESSYCFSSS